jgi:ESCRT-II complex subunit VPS22
MSTRRGVGLSAFSAHSTLSTSYATHGATLRNTHTSTLATQLSVFQTLLQTFAREHGATIRSNPTFRAEFARMCNAIGVDPLAGSNRPTAAKAGGGWWTQVVGGDVGDFYFGLGVRVVEVCRAGRGENGGLVGVREVRERVGRGRVVGGGGMEVTE